MNRNSQKSIRQDLLFLEEMEAYFIKARDNSGDLVSQDMLSKLIEDWKSELESLIK